MNITRNGLKLLTCWIGCVLCHSSVSVVQKYYVDWRTKNLTSLKSKVIKWRCQQVLFAAIFLSHSRNSLEHNNFSFPFPSCCLAELEFAVCRLMFTGREWHYWANLTLELSLLGGKLMKCFVLRSSMQCFKWFNPTRFSTFAQIGILKVKTTLLGDN